MAGFVWHDNPYTRVAVNGRPLAHGYRTAGRYANGNPVADVYKRQAY